VHDHAALDDVDEFLARVTDELAELFSR